MKKVKTKLLTIVIAITALLLISGLISAIAVQYKTINSSMDTTLTIVADQSSKNIVADLSKINEKVLNMAASSEFNMSSDILAKNNLIEVAEAEGVEKVCLYSTKGELLNGTFDCDIDIGNTPEFQEVVETGEARYILPVKLSDGEYYYILLAPVLDNGTVRRVFVAPYAYEELNTIVKNYTIGKNGYIYLINKQGQVISNENLEQAVLSSEPMQLEDNNTESSDVSSLHKKFIEDTENEYCKEKVDGETYLMAKSYSDTLSCFVVASLPMKEIFNLTPIYIIVGCFIVVFIAILLLISKILSKTIINPLTSSINRIKELAQGNITDPVKIFDSKDEIGEMTRALDETVNSLKFYVSNISEKLNDIADGDLTDRMHGKFKGDFVKIKATYNTILSSLIDTFGNINSSAEQVNSGASQVSNAAQALSQGATEQASSIEELSATIMDISSEIKLNAQSAKNAADIVKDNNDAITNCNKDMNEMLKAMDEISDSSYQIYKIIKVIDDIAFQTNILALNAAVEAARAGTAGKGFAVVADEVRNLAEKSAQAAKQTTNLIKSSVDSVNNGTKIAKQTADALSKIVENSENINKLVKNISIASDKQADSIVQINSGIEQISGVVQTNTATAEQSAAASEELSSQSHLLKDMVSRLKLGDKKKLFSSADSMVYSRETNTFGSNISNGNSTNDELPFGGTQINDDKNEEFTFKETPDENTESDEFSFGGTITEDTGNEELSFGGTLTEDTGSEEFAFKETPDEDAGNDEFAFGGTITEDAGANDEFAFNGTLSGSSSDVDDEDSKY